MQILFADYDFPDIGLEREIFASAGLDLKLAQCTDEAQVIEAARGATGILLHLVVRKMQRSLVHWVDRGQH